MKGGGLLCGCALVTLCCTLYALYSVLGRTAPWVFDPYSSRRADVVAALQRDAAKAELMAAETEAEAEWYAKAKLNEIESEIGEGARLRWQSMALVALVVTISAAGGIGGGGVLVPVLMLSEEMGPHGAIPLSKLTIFGNAVCQLALNWSKSHPMRPDRPLIDYDTTLMLEPPTLLGTVIGVLLNRMTPKWLIALLLLLFLVVTTWRTSSKAFSMYGRESAALAAVAALTPRATAQHYASEEATAKETKKKGRGKRPQVPWDVARQLAFVWCLVLAASLGRRRAGCGTAAYWMVLLALTAAIAVQTRRTGQSFLQRHTARVAARYEYCEGEVIWDDGSIVRLPVGCVVAGVMAGMLGVGGGMVMQPLMLEIGLLPDVASATAAFMMLFTASSTTLQFTLLGMVDWERNFVLPLIGAMGAAIGQQMIGRLVSSELPFICLFVLDLLLDMHRSCRISPGK